MVVSQIIVKYPPFVASRELHGDSVFLRKNGLQALISCNPVSVPVAIHTIFIGCCLSSTFSSTPCFSFVGRNGADVSCCRIVKQAVFLCKVLKMQLRYLFDLAGIFKSRIFTAAVIGAQAPLQSVAFNI